eukprot:scaffold17674_cov101-Isochrysis_galbana.AAC.1
MMLNRWLVSFAVNALLALARIGDGRSGQTNAIARGRVRDRPVGSVPSPTCTENTPSAAALQADRRTTQLGNAAVFGADGEPEVGLAGDGVHAADPGYLALAWSLSAGDKVGAVTAYVHGGSRIENDETVSSCKAETLCGFLTWRVPTNGWHRSPTLTAADGGSVPGPAKHPSLRHPTTI